MLACDQAGPLQDHEQDWKKEGHSEAEQEAGHERQVIADPRQRLLVDAADVALEAKQEMKRPGHRHEVGEACSRHEEDRRHDQEGQERTLLLHVEARSDEAPDLDREHRKAEHQRCEEGDLHFHEEGFEYVGVDQPALPSSQQGLDQHRENRLGEIEADEEGDRQGRQAGQQALSQLNQMLEQRLPGLVNVLHGSGRWLLSGSPRGSCGSSFVGWGGSAGSMTFSGSAPG